MAARFFLGLCPRPRDISGQKKHGGGFSFGGGSGSLQAMTLTNSDIAELITLRRDLHRTPELSGEEAATASLTTLNTSSSISATPSIHRR